MSNRTKTIIVIAVGIALGMLTMQYRAETLKQMTPILASTAPIKQTPTRTLTRTASLSPTLAITSTPSDTPTISSTPTEGRTPTPTNTVSITYTPHPDAIACTSHNNNTFHTLWDSVNNCHYDHEHGEDPFIGSVSDAFPGFDLYALLGNVQIGHTNPSSPMENTMKHGGFKWNVQLSNPQGCAGFEGAQTGVNGSVIQYHGFGNYAIEAEVRIHSTVVLLRQCRSFSPTNYGYVFINQLQDYGQRISPYQGTLLPYPNQPVPAFPVERGPYLNFDCIDLVAPFDSHCRAGFEQALISDSGSTWTSKPTGTGHSDSAPLFRLLWRVRDVYRQIHLDNWPTATYPFEFLWLCSSDNGASYNPTGCEYNNTTTQVHEIAGAIPATWDNLAGWDTDTRVGRITAQGFVDSTGNIHADCLEPGDNCYPIKLISAFVGTYGSVLVFTPNKGTNIVSYLPERDIYFCSGVVCSEESVGAVSSGWVGTDN